MNKRFEFKVLNLACDVGETLLKNGSEVSKIEEYVCKIASRYGFKGECFATLTCIIITIESKNGEITSLVRRVNSRDTNLDKVYKVSALMDKLQNYDMEEINDQLKKINEEKPYSIFVSMLGYSIGAAFFSILFVGSKNEFIASFVTGLSIGGFLKICNRLNIGTFFTNLICGFIATTVACVFKYIGFIGNVSTTIISGLMILVPGVAFINSMRDLFSGDLVTGTSRLLEVVMVGTAIAVGSGIALNIFFKLGGVN